MTFDFDTVIDRRGTASVKWDRYAGRDVIPAWVADMDFASPPAVLEALADRVGHGVFGYAHPPDELVATMEAHLAEAYGWRTDPDWYVWLPGLVCGLSVACRAVGEPGDEVLTAVPVYPPFLSVPAAMDRRLATVPLAFRDGRWGFHEERLAAAAGPRARLLLLCHPHNPVGRAWTRPELEMVAETCLSRRMVICSDEIHCQLVLEPDRPHVPLAALGPEVAARTITLMAPSKTYNIAGLGCSLAIIPDERLRRSFRRAMSGIVPGVNALGYVAALAAYRDGGPWLDALLDYLRANRDLVAAEIAGMPGLSVPHVEATYLAWLDAAATGLEDPAAFFEAAGVGLSDGRAFGGPGFLRLNFGCPRSTLEEILRRMRTALDARGGGA